MTLVVEPLSSATTEEAPEVIAEAPVTAPKEPSAEDRIWASRKRRLGQSAARAALVVPGVAAADFTILGTPDRPSLNLTCTLRPEADAAPIMEHIENSVVGDLELLLGVPFAARQIEFGVAGD